MNRKNATNLLINAGFKMESAKWGSMAPEPYSAGKNHFKPYFRDVFIGECVDGFYVTSNIVGDYREYRCHKTYPNTNVANIHGHGKTETDAVENFLVNFNSKNYNVRA